MIRAATTLTILLVLALPACQKTERTSSSATSEQSTEAKLSPEELGELGAEISKDPKRAQELLSGKGLTETSFEAQVRKVAASPEESKRYAKAFEKAKA